MKSFFVWLTILQILSHQLVAQKFLILDSYGFRRTKLYVGNDIIFRTQDTPARYQGTIIGLLDSAIYVTGFSDSIPLKQIHTFYFKRNFVVALRAGMNLFTVGFMGAGLIQPLTNSPYYDAKQSIIIGISAFAISQGLRLLKWKKFRLKPNRRRARILDLNPPLQNIYLE
jgi:hypothetical protein